MIDRPGPWGSGAFTLVEGFSSLDADFAAVREEPLAGTWLWQEDRTPRVRLVANERYWDKRRGPRLQEVVFRNDVSREDALALVCDREGEVDLVTELGPADAGRVGSSEHAKLVTIDALRTLAGIFDRDAEGLPLGDRRARQALNLAVNRSALVAEAMGGHARPLAGLTPPTALTALHRLPRRLAPHPHDPELARRLWVAAGGNAISRPLRLTAPARRRAVAEHVARDLRTHLGIAVEVTLDPDPQLREHRRALAERTRPRPWDVLLLEHQPQSVDAPPHELHRAWAGEDGEYRAGPPVPALDDLYARLVAHTAMSDLVRLSNRLDALVRQESLGLFLCAPDALYAVNREVDFTPYRTSLEFAETAVTEHHWSRRGG